MKSLALGLIALTGLALAPVATQAAPPAAKAAVLKCPSCGMPMPTKKTAKFPQAIKVDGKTYYCCAGCPSGMKAAAYQKAHKGAVLAVNTGKKA